MARQDELVPCPFCGAQVRRNHLKKHKSRRCAQSEAASPFRALRQKEKRAKKERAERLSMRPLNHRAPISKEIGPSQAEEPKAGRCRLCGGSPIPGDDVCYTCAIK